MKVQPDRSRSIKTRDSSQFQGNSHEVIRKLGSVPHFFVGRVKSMEQSKMRFPFYSRVDFLSMHDLETTRKKIKSLSHQMEVSLSESKISLSPKSDMAVRGASLLRIGYTGRIIKENERTVINGSFHLPYPAVAIIAVFLGLFMFQILPLLLQFSLSNIDPIGAVFGGIIIILLVGVAIGVTWMALADTSNIRQAIEAALRD